MQALRWLQWLALGLGFVGLVLWLFGGPNLGWSKTSIARERLDEVTGLTAVEWERTFLPGVDFLAATLGGAAVVFGLAGWIRRRARGAGQGRPQSRGEDQGA